MTSRRERERRGRREGFFSLKTGIFYCFLYSRRKQNKSRWALCIFFFPVQKTGKLWHCSSKLWLLWCLRNLCKKLNCSFPIPSSGLRLSRRRALFLLLLQAGVAHLILIRGRNVECVILPCVLLCFCHCFLHQSIYSTQSHHPWMQWAYMDVGFNGLGNLAFPLGDQISCSCAIQTPVWICINCCR